MESGFAYEKIVWLLCCLLLSSCLSEQVAVTTPDLSFTQSGDLIYRFGDGFFSGFFRDFSTREKLYSHVGIILRPENSDSVFVMHAEASELTGIGNVRRDPASIFLKGVDEWAVYRVQATENQRREIASLAFLYHQKNVPFDSHFDTEDSTAIYCTELVARCVNKALGRFLIKPGVTRSGKQFIAIDDTYLIDEIKLIKKSNTPKNGIQSY
ncbi:MAG: YiiX/YebB-like N1pC/P60 family cysteine hydrolase [Bacteroidota bacterium]